MKTEEKKYEEKGEERYYGDTARDCERDEREKEIGSGGTRTVALTSNETSFARDRLSRTYQMYMERSAGRL